MALAKSDESFLNLHLPLALKKTSIYCNRKGQIIYLYCTNPTNMAKKKTTKKVAKKAATKPARKAGGKAAKKSAKKTSKKSAPKKAVKKAAKKVTKKVVKKAAKKPAATAVKKALGLNTYLTFNGNCEEAFNFYRSIFGGSFQMISRYGEVPASEGMTIPESEKNKIMHVSLPVGPKSMLMGSDSSDAFGHASVIGNNFAISIDATSDAEANKLYIGLSANGKQTMPMSKTFWGSYFGMLVDQYGVSWMISA